MYTLKQELETTKELNNYICNLCGELVELGEDNRIAHDNVCTKDSPNTNIAAYKAYEKKIFDKLKQEWNKLSFTEKLKQVLKRKR